MDLTFPTRVIVGSIATMLFCACAALTGATAPATAPGAAPTPAAVKMPSPNDPIDTAAFTRKIKVACVGDSITQGSGSSPGTTNAYPTQLGRMLGDTFEVRNFGVSGATLLNKGDKPYQKQALFKASKEYNPDVVVLMLGTNDTKPQNWSHLTEFVPDYKDLVGQYQKLESKPRIFVCHPCIAPGIGNYGINEPNIEAEVPLIDGIAKEMGLGVIDIHGATKGHDGLFPDRVHPNNDGANILAGTVYRALTGRAYEGPSVIVAATRPASRPAATQR